MHRSFTTTCWEATGRIRQILPRRSYSLHASERSLQIIRSLQNDLDQYFPAAQVLVRQLEQGPPFDAPIELRLFSPDVDRLWQLGEQVRTILAQVANVIHTAASLKTGRPKLWLQLDAKEAPLAGLGILSLWLFDYPCGFTAIVSIMGLIGVAVNDSIVVLAALREHPQARLGDCEAVETVVMRSTRHVLSTTVTTIAGFTPLIISGGGFWPPLAVATAGGVAGSTLMALYFIPPAYLLLVRRRAAALQNPEVDALVAVAKPNLIAVEPGNVPFKR